MARPSKAPTFRRTVDEVKTIDKVTKLHSLVKTIYLLMTF